MCLFSVTCFPFVFHFPFGLLRFVYHPLPSFLSFHLSRGRLAPCRKRAREAMKWRFTFGTIIDYRPFIIHFGGFCHRLAIPSVSWSQICAIKKQCFFSNIEIWMCGRQGCWGKGRGRRLQKMLLRFPRLHGCCPRVELLEVCSFVRVANPDLTASCRNLCKGQKLMTSIDGILRQWLSRPSSLAVLRAGA